MPDLGGEENGSPGTINSALHTGIPVGESTVIPVALIAGVGALLVSVAASIKKGRTIAREKEKLSRARTRRRKTPDNPTSKSASKKKRKKKKNPSPSWSKKKGGACVSKSYNAALGDVEVGKHIRGDVYVHTSLVTDLDPTLQACILDTVSKVKARVGKEAPYTVVKISKRGTVSLLNYPGFMRDAVPELVSVWSYNTISKRLTQRKYDTDNPPVLHRKELMIDPLNRRYRQFSLLTEDMDRVRLIKGRVGYRLAWEARLRDKGFSIDGHTLVDEKLNVRARTAIYRGDMSMPLRFSLSEGIVRSRVLDWGCGRGDDIDALKDLGYEVTGYDPHYFNRMPRGRNYRYAQAVYVLNVIEAERDRRRVIERVRERVKAGAYVMFAVRSDANVREAARLGDWVRDGDGFRTSSGTFQKGFTQAELSELLLSEGLTVITVVEQGGSVIVISRV